VDAIAFARSEGYDALLKLTVWPSLKDVPSSSVEASLYIELILTRIAGDKILRNMSYKAWKSGNDVGLNNLTGPVLKAADHAIELYASVK